jgi:hypothetical protein
MKSISARFRSQTRPQKASKANEIESKLSLSELLQRLVTVSAAGTGITSVELYINNPTLELKYSPESDVWESKFPKHFDTRIVLSLSSDLSRGDTLTSLVVSTYIFYYNIKESNVAWEVASSGYKETLHGSGFEKAQTILGPFPVRYILDYLSLSQFKVYSGASSTAHVSDSIFSDRDFAIQLMQYLEHLMTTRHSDERPSSPTRDAFLYQIRIESSISLLSRETEEILRGNPDSGAHPRIHRVF